MAEEHDTHINFHVKDHSSGTIHKITHAVENLGERAERTLSHLTEMGAALSGIAGAFGFERMIESGRESLEQIGKLSKLTDMTADHVAAMRDVFEQSGLGAEQMARSMTMLSKKALQLDENGKAISAEARRWGIDLRNGPEAALLSISDAVKKHRIGQAEVMKLTGATRENLGGMMELLEGGREELTKSVKEASELNKHLAGDEALEQFKKFHEASTKIHEAWRRISEKVVIGLAPVMTKMADKISHWVDHLNVDKFVNTLTKGLELAVRHAKELARIMLINASLERFTGAGIVGTAGRLSRFAGRVPGVGLAGRLAGGAVQVAGGVGGEVFGAMGGMLAPIAKLFSAFSSLGPIVSGLVSFAAKATVITAIVSAVIMLGHHSEKLKEVALKLWEAVKKIGSAVLSVFDTEAVQWLGEKLIWAVTKLAEAVAYLLRGLANILGGPDKWKEVVTGVGERGREAAITRAAGRFAKEMGLEESYVIDNIMQLQMLSSRFRDLRDEEYEVEASALEMKKKQAEDLKAISGLLGSIPDLFHRATEAVGHVAGKVLPQILPQRPVFNQDFRGSRFEIEQKFAEGFDPDRIAVAFANDISAMGERKMTSTLGPQFIR